jgi:hypothetical protein
MTAANSVLQSEKESRVAVCIDGKRVHIEAFDHAHACWQFIGPRDVVFRACSEEHYFATGGLRLRCECAKQRFGATNGGTFREPRTNKR